MTRALSSGVSVVGVFLTPWGAERREGGFLRCPALLQGDASGPAAAGFRSWLPTVRWPVSPTCRGHSLYPFVEAVSRDAEARGDFRD